jgi:hypothetical protein
MTLVSVVFCLITFCTSIYWFATGKIEFGVLALFIAAIFFEMAMMTVERDE